MYKVIWVDKASIREALQVIVNEVNKAEEQGWRAQGGISIAYQDDSDYVYVAQAMVKYDAETNDRREPDIKIMA